MDLKERLFLSYKKAIDEYYSSLNTDKESIAFGKMSALSTLIMQAGLDKEWKVWYYDLC